MDISLGFTDTSSTLESALLKRLSSRSLGTVLASAVQNAATIGNSTSSEGALSDQRLQNELVTNTILNTLLNGTEAEDTLALSLFDLESLAAGSLPLESGLQSEVDQTNQNIFQLIVNTAFAENSGNSLFSDALFLETASQAESSAVSEEDVLTGSGDELIQQTLDLEREEEAKADAARLEQARRQDELDFSFLQEEAALINKLLLEQVFSRNIIQAFLIEPEGSLDFNF